MSLHRYDAKRDRNEPAIVSTLEALGCVVWRVSGKGLPDLSVFYRRRSKKGATLERQVFFADVKGPKEKATPAQVEKWTALINLGFSVFILRTPEDAQKMLNNALQPWEPAPMTLVERVKAKRAIGQRIADAVLGHTPPRSTPVDAAKPVRGLGAEMMAEMLKPPGQENYDAALRRALDAAKEAEATFAPKALKHNPACPDCVRMQRWCAGCCY